MSHARVGGRIHAIAGFVLLTMICSACGQQDQAPQTPAPEAEDGSAAILEALLSAWRAEAPDEDGEPEALLLHVTSRAPALTSERWAKQRAWLPGKLEALHEETLDAFAEANATPLDLPTVLEPTATLHFISAEEYAKAFADAGASSAAFDESCRQLIARYPGVHWIRSISAPGVSRDGRQALVYATEVLGARIATGYYFLLALDDGVWGVTGKVTAWTS